ncbi:hypothetical protein [Streptomyces sp. NPDC086519]|uniref:hypothetical protein n=1 Tax=Streptomyces sp. NPDC086519 TaxID=3154863 RepID=UPI00344A881F
MSEEAARGAWTPQQRALMFIGFAADQVRDLLPFVTGEQSIEPAVVEVACKESFVLNVRLIIDFLTRGNPRFDILAKDYAPEWRPGEELKIRLDQWHELASRHAMHLSRERVPDDVQDVDPIGPEDYRQMAADCVEALVSFRAAVARR